MRQESNNGIDLLLRQLGRREDAFSSEASSEPSSKLAAQHLDADELSSYVANALPAAARARYTAHLADCSSCRKMVAQLSAAEGVVVAQQPAAVVGPSGLKSFLASLFSPLVLRYAIPALGVIVIAVVGFVMVRQGQRETSVARLNDADQNRTVAPASRSEATPPQGFVDQVARNGAADKPNEVAKAGAAAPATADKASPRDERGQDSGAAVGAAPGPAPGQQTQPVTTASEPPPPAPKAAPAEEAERQAEPEKKKTDAISKADSSVAQREYDAAKKEQKQADDRATTATATGSANRASEPRRAKIAESAGISRDGGTASAPQSREDSSRTRKRDGEGNFATETRAVAGREFYKRGDVWIDADYNNQGITHIARGSEEYRSLIEDEPAIRTIAETLKSEFIVVWKSRAYRVH